MDTRGNGRRSPRITSALVSVGGLVVAMVTGAGLWIGHEQSSTTQSSDSSASDSSTSDSSTSTDSGTSTDQGVTQGSTGTGSAGTGSSDATTTGS